MFNHLAKAALVTLGLVASGLSAGAVTYDILAEDGRTRTYDGKWGTSVLPGGADIGTARVGNLLKNRGFRFVGMSSRAGQDVWTFFATTSFTAAIDVFAAQQAKNAHRIKATFSLTGPNSISTLAMIGEDYRNHIGTFSGGLYSFAVQSTGGSKFLYDLRVTSIPLPASAMLLGSTALFLSGAGLVMRRKRAPLAA